VDAVPPSTRDLATPEEFRPITPPRATIPTLPDDVEATAAAKKADARPAWLERGPVYASGREAAGGDSGPGLPLAGTGSTVSASADALTHNALAWAKRLAQTTDPSAFAQAAPKLEGALRLLAQRGEVDALWQVSSTMHAVASEGRGAVGSRAWSAAKLL